jgi:tetratricopeptide (TPR) repeat protein
MRYAHDPEGYGAMMGNIDDFEGGFTEFNGAPFPDEDVLSQMQAEFACDEEFTTDGLTTTLRKEWEFTVAPVEGKVYPGEVSLPRGDGTFYPGRNRKDIKDLMKLATSIEGKLVREEVIAVRLYTGPAFLCLNKGLREGGLKAKKKGIQNFPATCAALNSAIKKLRVVTQLPKMRKLFFGIRGLALPQKVLESASFVNFAYTSATPNIVVAREYAGGKHASLFEIQVGQIDRGAFIGEFSYYSEEEEYVLAPMAHYEIVGKRIEGGVNIYELRLNVIGKTETLQELRENRKRQVLAVTDSLNQDCLRLTGHDSLQVAKIVKAEIEPGGYEWFNQGSNFSQILVKLEDALLRELEEKQEAMRQAAGRELLGTEAQVECTVDALLQELEVEQEALPHALPETKAQAERTATLRTCVQLAKRCSAGDADGRRAVLAAQELLVASQGPAAMGSTAAAADDLVELASQLEETANDYPRALEILERALRAKKALQPPALEADVALIFHRQGRVLWRMGRLDEALVQYREALKIRTRLFGYEDRDVAASYNNIALLHENQGKYEEALEAHHKALEIRTRVSGPQHPSVADSHNNIALVYENQRKYDEALESHKKALEIRTRAFGSQHPQDAAISYFNTGLVYRTLGNAKEAKEMFTKSYSIFLKVFGPYHPRTKMSKHNQS